MDTKTKDRWIEKTDKTAHYYPHMRAECMSRIADFINNGNMDDNDYYLSVSRYGTVLISMGDKKPWWFISRDTDGSFEVQCWEPLYRETFTAGPEAEQLRELFYLLFDNG